MNYLGIDVESRGAGLLISKLRRLKTTHNIRNMGRYTNDPSWTMLYIDTEMTEDEMDAWLYGCRFPDGWISSSVFTRQDHPSPPYIVEQMHNRPLEES